MAHLPPRERWRKPARSAWIALTGERAAAVNFNGTKMRIVREARAGAGTRAWRASARDILSPELTAEQAAASLRRAGPDAELGDAMLDQTLLAGIGNIFKSEGCWAAKIDPWRKLGDLSDDELAVGRRRRAGSDARGGPQRAPAEAGLPARPPALPALPHRRSARAPRGTRPARPTGAPNVSDNRRVDTGGARVMSDLTELLQRVPLFSELSDAELERVAQVAVPRSFPRETRVFHEGDPATPATSSATGSCRVTREHPDGRAITLANLGPGAIFGELAMLDGEARSASVEAVEDTKLLALPARDVRALIRSHPEMGEKLIVALTRRLREANERITRQSFQTVPEPGRRGAEPAAGRGRPRRRSSATASRSACASPTSPSSPGTSRESVSRFLATLERAGIVQVGRAKVTVIEPDRLNAYIF